MRSDTLSLIATSLFFVNYFLIRLCFFLFFLVLTGWAELMHGPFKRHILPGGHFYFMEGDNETSLINLISAAVGFSSSAS